MATTIEKPRVEKLYLITGTFHGSHVYAKSEGAARRAFHEVYNGESITHVRVMSVIDRLTLEKG